MASKTNPIVFLRQVRAEAAKIKWPTRHETVVSTIVVLVASALASVFFFVADQIINFGVWQSVDLLRYLFG